MKPRQLFPAQETRTEITVVNLRFIATIAPAFSVAQAKTIIARIREEFTDASHMEQRATRLWQCFKAAEWVMPW